MPVGYSADVPLVLAETAGPLPRTADEFAEAAAAPIRVRVIKPVEGLSVSQAAWVTGPGVQKHIDSGAFVEITRTSQKRRQWRVGPFVYSDYRKASRVALAQGTTPVEIA